MSLCWGAAVCVSIWLTKEWRDRELLKNIQLTISGCLGPCDLPNVVIISDASGSVGLGNIRHLYQDRSLVFPPGV